MPAPEPDEVEIDASAVGDLPWSELLTAAERGKVRIVVRSPSGMAFAVVPEPELALLRSSQLNPVLTPRERQIARLVEAGQPGAEIAEILQLSQNTVVQHLASLRRKLYRRTSVAAVERARELGLLDEPE